MGLFRLTLEQGGFELLDALHEAVVVCDAQDRIAYVNAEAERLLEAPAKALVGSAADGLHPAALGLAGSGVLRRIAHAARATRGGAERTLVRRADGVEIEVGAVVSLVPTGSGELVVAMLRRISDGAAHEHRSRDTELETYRLVFEHAPLGIAHFDQRGVVTACNDHFCRTFGTSKRALLGLSLLSLEDPRAVQAVRAALAGELGQFQGDYSAMTADTQSAIRALVAPILGDDGRVQGGVAMVEDISERRRAEDAVRSSQAQFRTLIQSAPDGIAVHRAGRLVFVNPAFCRMLGYASSGELLGREVAELVDPAQHAELERRSCRMLETGLPLPVWEQRMRRSDGSELTAEVASLPLQFDGERAILEHARDVGERKLIEARLARADRLASVGTLAAGVAHEINNPLAYALGSLEVAARSMETLRRALAGREELEPTLATLCACMANALEGNQRVRVIVRDLVTFSRARSESHALLDVRMVLDSAVNLAWNEIRHRARLVKRYQPTAPVLADESRLGQVFLNLLLNAAQAIPEGEVAGNQILLVTRQDGERVVVMVEDTGGGVAPEHAGRIFEPFFTTKPSGGSGLGLSICHGIVRGLGGEILVETCSGRGMRFSVMLPSAGAEQTFGPGPIPAEKATPGSARILIIDDEPLLADTLRVALFEHRVVAVASGRAAIEWLAKDEAFDLVLCDLMMPELSGEHVYEHVREHHPRLARRFAFMTGGAFTDAARRFVDGFDGPCLEKPFPVERIEQLLCDLSAG
jgi:two-component system, cell cycle sensor histidine kinase and response regulator CckA